MIGTGYRGSAKETYVKLDKKMARASNSLRKLLVLVQLLYQLLGVIAQFEESDSFVMSQAFDEF